MIVIGTVTRIVIMPGTVTRIVIVTRTVTRIVLVTGTVTKICTHLQCDFVSVTENFLLHNVQSLFAELGCKERPDK